MDVLIFPVWMTNNFGFKTEIKKLKKKFFFLKKSLPKTDKRKSVCYASSARARPNDAKSV